MVINHIYISLNITRVLHLIYKPLKQVYTCSMVQVYLPMGYPLQSGQEFSNIIYQGNVVRLYTLPKDPRSDAQLQNRKFLSDIVKVRKNLGAFAKGACITVMGPQWQTVLYQMIKADIEGWWSGALEEWENFGEVNKNNWRNACPYQATFNDVGEIFFGLSRVLHRALLFYSGISWESAEWTETQSADALVWWGKNLVYVMEKVIYDDGDQRLKYTGTWTRINHAQAFNGSYYQANAAVGGSMEAYFKSHIMRYVFKSASTNGSVDIQIDGGAVVRWSLDYGDEVGFWLITPTVPSKNLHRIKITAAIGVVNIDSLEV